jgi:hypothetical protein
LLVLTIRDSSTSLGMTKNESLYLFENGLI